MQAIINACGKQYTVSEGQLVYVEKLNVEEGTEYVFDQVLAIIDGEKKYAACIGGMLSVMDGKVTLVPTTFEWADQIDKERSAASESRARAVLSDKTSSNTDIKLAEARLKRALIRQSVAEKK